MSSIAAACAAAWAARSPERSQALSQPLPRAPRSRARAARRLVLLGERQTSRCRKIVVLPEAIALGVLGAQSLVDLKEMTSWQKRQPSSARFPKKVSKAASGPIKPVKQTLTKSALLNLIAEENDIPRKTCGRRIRDPGKRVPRLSSPTRHRRIRAARSFEGQPAQQVPARESGNACPQPS